jgi:hypothetical protein
MPRVLHIVAYAAHNALLKLIVVHCIEIVVIPKFDFRCSWGKEIRLVGELTLFRDWCLLVDEFVRQSVARLLFIGFLQLWRCFLNHHLGLLNSCHSSDLFQLGGSCFLLLMFLLLNNDFT